MVTVLLVDDHVYIRKVIWYLLETTPDIKIVATASNGSEAITAALSIIRILWSWTVWRQPV
jgi:chemotaxis response regulator CheB